MKLGIIASFSTLVAAIVGSLALATVSPAPVDAADACQRTDYKTEMVRDACTKGGQKAAKDAMKAFMKEKKVKSCNQCHSKLAPTYELKKDGLEQFQKLGGKMLAGADTAKPAPKESKTATPPAKELPKTAAPAVRPWRSKGARSSTRTVAMALRGWAAARN